MRDIYRRLGLLPDATPEAIAAEVAKLPPRNHIRRAAEQILLNAQRREHYYEAVITLRTIGQLRANLGLSNAALWREGSLQDFDFSATATARSQLDRLRSSPQRHAPAPAPKSTRPTAPEKESRSIAVVLAAIAIGIVVWGISRAPSTGSSGAPGFASAAAPIPQTFPYTGILLNEARGLSEGAPFTVRTAPNGGYYIKVVRVDTGAIVLTAFIRGGDEVSTLLPSGSYELRYASGSTWFGFERLFGDDTAYAKADQIFHLRQTPYGYEGVTVELILQRSGNLRTRGISAGAF